MSPELPSSSYSHRKHRGETCQTCRAAAAAVGVDRYRLTDSGRELLADLELEGELADLVDQDGDERPGMSRT